MSFIIKGFDTDGNCLHCYFQSEDSDRCILTDDDIPLYGKGHPDSCPLIPLPAGHGRLIDADAFKAMCLSATKEAKPDFIRHEDWLKSCAVTISFCKDIDEQPTIIEAEGGGEDG